MAQGGREGQEENTNAIQTNARQWEEVLAGVVST